VSQSIAGKVPANKERMKRILLTLLAAIVLSSAITGCRTARGAGEDMEKAGQKIQDKADEHSTPP
jgi:predicted small secreted protein